MITITTNKDRADQKTRFKFFTMENCPLNEIQWVYIVDTAPRYKGCLSIILDIKQGVIRPSAYTNSYFLQNKNSGVHLLDPGSEITIKLLAE